MKLLITADWHLRDDKPRCRPRNENWIEFQEECVSFIFETAVDEKVDGICVCGDIFHYPVVSAKIVNHLLHSILIENIPFYILPGQHDMKNHDNKSLYNCSYGTLASVMVNTCICHMDMIGQCAPFGIDSFTGYLSNGIYFAHKLIVPSDKGVDFGDMVKASTLLEENPEANIIFAGDNHEGFIEKYNDRVVAVPGCLNRQSIALKDYHPSVIIYDTEKDLKKGLHRYYNEKDLCELEVDNIAGNKNTVDLSNLVDSLKGVTMQEMSLSFFDNLALAMKKGDLDKDCIYYIKSMVESLRRS